MRVSQIARSVVERARGQSSNRFQMEGGHSIIGKASQHADVLKMSGFAIVTNPQELSNEALVKEAYLNTIREAGITSISLASAEQGILDEHYQPVHEWMKVTEMATKLRDAGITVSAKSILDESIIEHHWKCITTIAESGVVFGQARKSTMIFIKIQDFNQYLEQLRQSEVTDISKAAKQKHIIQALSITMDQSFSILQSLLRAQGCTKDNHEM